MKTLGFHPDIPLFFLSRPHGRIQTYFPLFLSLFVENECFLPFFFTFFLPAEKEKTAFRGVYLIQCRSPPDAFSLLAQSSRPRREKPRLQKSRAEPRYSWTAFPLQWIRQIDAPLLVIYFSPKHVNVYTLIGCLTRRERTIQRLNRRGSWIVEESLKRERGREKERLGEGRNNTRIYTMFVFLDDQVFFSPPLRFILYPAFWSQTLFVFCSHFCAGTIVYKSFDSARKKKEKREKKKREKKEETVEIEK